MSQANHILHHNVTARILQAESLDRARNGQTMTNYPAIFAGFIAKGTPEADIRPISQTEPTAAREAPPGNRSYGRRHGRAYGHVQSHDRDPGYCDPGELAADRWNETHY